MGAKFGSKDCKIAKIVRNINYTYNRFFYTSYLFPCLNGKITVESPNLVVSVSGSMYDFEQYI